MNRAETPAGELCWEVFRTCERQVRAGFSGAYGLDFGAVFQVATALGADFQMLAELLPLIEPIVLNFYRSE